MIGITHLQRIARLALPLRALSSKDAAFRCFSKYSLPTSIKYTSRGICMFRQSRPQLGVVTFKLADIGEGITEVELLQWHVKEGAEIEEMDEVCQVQSDKSAVDISSPYGGKIIKMHHKLGEMIKIGTPLMDIDVPNQGDSTPVETPASTASTSTESSPPTSTPSDIPENTVAKPVPRHDAPMASPACRAIAREFGISLFDITPTGPGGRITKEDVLNFKNNLKSEKDQGTSQKSTTPAQSSTTVTKQGEVKEEILLTGGVAKGMVKSMNASLNIPHMSLQEDIDLTNLMQVRAGMNEHLKSTKEDIKITVTSFIIKAVSTALLKVPIMNSKFDIVSQNKYTLYHNHNISIAIDTPHGLLVPNMKNVETLSLVQIQKQLIELQSLAVANKLSPSHLTGGTISISNVGAIGGTAVRPILFDGQATILGLGRSQKLPRYNPITKQFDPRDIMNITASVDHRHVDGATVARFIKQLRSILENVNLMML